MTVTSIRDAWAEVQKIFPTYYEHDTSRSERAGYNAAAAARYWGMTYHRHQLVAALPEPERCH